MLLLVCNLVVRSLGFFNPFVVFLKSRSLVFISFFNLLFIHGGLSRFDPLSLFQSSLAVMVSRLVSIYSRVLLNSLFYTLPVGFPIDGEFTPGLDVFLGAYINFSENDIVVGYSW